LGRRIDAVSGVERPNRRRRYGIRDLIPRLGRVAPDLSIGASFVVRFGHGAPEEAQSSPVL